MTQWTLEDNHGILYPIVIPNSFLIPKALSKLISLQHWAQMEKDKQTKIMRNMVHHLQECSYSGVRAKIATNACSNWTKQGTNAIWNSTPPLDIKDMIHSARRLKFYTNWSMQINWVPNFSWPSTKMMRKPLSNQAEPRLIYHKHWELSNHTT